MMKKGMAGLLVAALVIGCSTTTEDTTPRTTAMAPVVEGNTGAVSMPMQDYKPVERQIPGRQPEQQPLSGSYAGIGSSVFSDASNSLSIRSIYFDFDSNVVREEYQPAVVAHAKFLLDNPTARMMIQGNTDERGTREYNLVLGQRRADAVRDMLLTLGAREEQIESVSLGEESPFATGHTEAAYEQNRRSDMLYRYQDLREF